MRFGRNVSDPIPTLFWINQALLHEEKFLHILFGIIPVIKA